MMYRFIQKSLNWGIKIASLAVTGPATWQVSSELFRDIENPVILLVMRLAAVFLVEGVMMSNWLLLEFDKSANELVKARYGLTALAIYAGMVWIGIQHDGALVGIVFRAALLAALIGSGWDTYILTWQRITASVDRSPENSGKVKRHARNLAIRESMMRRDAEHKITSALIEAEATGSLHQTSLYRQRLLASNEVEHKAESLRITEREERVEAQANGKKKRLQQLPSLETGAGTGPKALSSNVAQRFDGQPLRQSILGALGDDRNYTTDNLSEKLGVPLDEITSEIESLVQDGLIEPSGRSFVIVGNAEFRSNGKRLRSRIRGR